MFFLHFNNHIVLRQKWLKFKNQFVIYSLLKWIFHFHKSSFRWFWKVHRKGHYFTVVSVTLGDTLLFCYSNEKFYYSFNSDLFKLTKYGINLNGLSTNESKVYYNFILWLKTLNIFSDVCVNKKDFSEFIFRYFRFQ